jgi:hypothetical protein
LSIVTKSSFTLGDSTFLNANLISSAAINMGTTSNVGGNITASTGTATLPWNSTVGGDIITIEVAVNVSDSSTISGGGTSTQAGVDTLTTDTNVSGSITTDAGAINIGIRGKFSNKGNM